MSETPLFSDLRFNVSLSRQGVDDLGRLIRAHGGRICDPSDASNNLLLTSDHQDARESKEGEAQREEGLVFVVDSFDEDNVRFAWRFPTPTPSFFSSFNRFFIFIFFRIFETSWAHKTGGY